MNDKHIIEILDSAPRNSLSREQLEIVRTHSLECSECQRAYLAASLSSVLIKERSQTTVEPSPFFQTKVLAALRARQAAENVPVFGRLWKSAGVLVSSMAVTTAALAALSILVPANTMPASEQTATAYSAESVIFDQGVDDQLSYEQVLSTIYADEEEAK